MTATDVPALAPALAIPAATPFARLDELLGRRVSLRSLAVLRVLVGPIVLVHLRPFLSDAVHGHVYRDAFYEPYASWYPELPRGGYIALLWAGAAAAVALSAGLWTRAASTVAFAVVTYNLFLSTTHFHSNRAYLVIVLAALAVSPCGRELSLDSRKTAGSVLDLRSPARSPAWPLWLLRFEASVVYGASGLSKLLDPDWFGGLVTWGRVTDVRDRLAESPLPGWAISLLTERSFHTVAAKVIVTTELFIAIALWFRKTRYAAVWVAVAFHLAIELSASVQVFSYLAIAALTIWAAPSCRDRLLMVDPTSTAACRFARVVAALDWLARFRIEHGPPGSDVRAIDRDGTERSGRSAVILVLSRLPVTAWFALPGLLGRPRRAVPSDRAHGGHEIPYGARGRG